MNFTITVSVDPFLQQTITAFTKMLTTQSATLGKIMASLADIQAQNVALQAAVAAEDTLIDSAVVLINGFNGKLADIQAQLAAAIAAGADPAMLNTLNADLTAMVVDVTNRTNSLAAAVAANTPATPKAVGTPTVDPGPTPPAQNLVAGG